MNKTWATMTRMSDVAHAIAELYETNGVTPRSDAISQVDHARQAAAFAMAGGADADTIVAGFAGGAE